MYKLGYYLEHTIIGPYWLVNDSVCEYNVTYWVDLPELSDN